MNIDFFEVNDIKNKYPKTYEKLLKSNKFYKCLMNCPVILKEIFYGRYLHLSYEDFESFFDSLGIIIIIDINYNNYYEITGYIYRIFLKNCEMIKLIYNSKDNKEQWPIRPEAKEKAIIKSLEIAEGQEE